MGVAIVLIIPTKIWFCPAAITVSFENMVAAVMETWRYIDFVRPSDLSYRHPHTYTLI